MGIDNGEDYQIVYSDTPGMLRPQYKLQEGMMSFMNGLYKIEPPNFENIGKLNEKFAEACAKPPQMRITLVSGVLDEKWTERYL